MHTGSSMVCRQAIAAPVTLAAKPISSCAHHCLCGLNWTAHIVCLVSPQGASGSGRLLLGARWCRAHLARSPCHLANIEGIGMKWGEGMGSKV